MQFNAHELATSLLKNQDNVIFSWINVRPLQWSKNDLSMHANWL